MNHCAVELLFATIWNVAGVSKVLVLNKPRCTHTHCRVKNNRNCHDACAHRQSLTSQVTPSIIFLELTKRMAYCCWFGQFLDYKMCSESLRFAIVRGKKSLSEDVSFCLYVFVFRNIMKATVTLWLRATWSRPSMSTSVMNVPYKSRERSILSPWVSMGILGTQEAKVMFPEFLGTSC